MKILDFRQHNVLKEGLPQFVQAPSSSPQDEDLELLLFLTGTAQFCVGSMFQQVKPGHLFICRTSQVRYLITDPRWAPPTFYDIRFQLKIEELETLGFTEMSWERLFPIETTPIWRIRLDNLRRRAVSQRHLQKLALNHEFMALLCDVLEEIRQKSDEPVDAKIQNPYVLQTLLYFKQNLGGEVDLQTIARQLQISEEYLIRIFKKELETTPMRYFQRLKQDAAADLLLNTNLSMKEISWKLGYSSPYHFSKSFKQRSGQSPLGFRNDNLRKEIGD